MYENSVILITGGTGSWGRELVMQLLYLNPRKIIVLSRNENSQVQMRREIEDSRLTFCVADIRDKEAILKICENVDYVFHLAALKHVPVCEEHPLEALKTNIKGTQNIIEASIEKNVKKFINVSTDKAADPANLYGMTKAIAEKLTIHANYLNSNTKFMCLRGGNVLGTNGSVLHVFMDQIEQNSEIKITDKRMTRFFITKEKAINLLLNAAKVGIGGETFVMNLPAFRILDLAEVLINNSGKNVKINEIGKRPGEKLHEVLISENERDYTRIYDEDYYIVFPTIEIAGLKTHYSTSRPIFGENFESNHSLRAKEEIQEMLREGNFL